MQWKNIFENLFLSQYAKLSQMAPMSIRSYGALPTVNFSEFLNCCLWWYLALKLIILFITNHNARLSASWRSQNALRCWRHFIGDAGKCLDLNLSYGSFRRLIVAIYFYWSCFWIDNNLEVSIVRSVYFYYDFYVG